MTRNTHKIEIVNAKSALPPVVSQCREDNFLAKLAELTFYARAAVQSSLHRDASVQINSYTNDVRTGYILVEKDVMQGVARVSLTRSGK